tara:strand:- start:458 stop:607 length:150 start_codon:yes stop_codon:yes gene_type:complete
MGYVVLTWGVVQVVQQDYIGQQLAFSSLIGYINITKRVPKKYPEKIFQI